MSDQLRIIITDFSRFYYPYAEAPHASADPPDPVDEVELPENAVVSDLSEFNWCLMATGEERNVMARSQRLGLYAANALQRQEWWPTYQATHQELHRNFGKSSERDQDMDLVKALWTALDAITVTNLGGFLAWEGRYDIFFDPCWTHEVGSALDSGAMYSGAYARSMRDRLDVLASVWAFEESAVAALDVCRALFALIIAADARLAPKFGIE